MGVLKLNIDGAAFEKIHKAGVGALHRNERGEVVMALSKI